MVDVALQHVRVSVKRWLRDVSVLDLEAETHGLMCDLDSGRVSRVPVEVLLAVTDEDVELLSDAVKKLDAVRERRLSVSDKKLDGVTCVVETVADQWTEFDKAVNVC